MSRRVTIYNHVDGKWLYTGARTDTKAQKLIALGHLAIPGANSPYTRYDLPTQTVVPDLDKLNEKEQNEIDRKDRSTKANQRLNQLRQTIGDDRDIATINLHLDTLIRILAVLK
jgi:hypothetical protein